MRKYNIARLLSVSNPFDTAEQHTLKEIEDKLKGLGLTAA